jgi:ferredoxin hydrogenase large subunit/hydrogenase large subunit
LIASCLAQEQAYGVKPAPNGRLMRNLNLGANYIQSHLVHFISCRPLISIDITASFSTRARPASRASSLGGREIQGKAAVPAAPFCPVTKDAYIEDTEINIGRSAIT